MNKILAIVGMCGSGKSIASEYYENLGYQKVYFGGVTMMKLKEEGLEVNPENERMMSRRLREEYGMGAYAYLLLPTIEELSKKGNVVLDGLYSWDELKILKDKFPDMIVLSIVVNKKDRYSRLVDREIRPLTNEEANKRDIAEIENSAKGGPIAFADYYILNNGNLDDYKNDLDKITKLIEGEE
jgi:dephospho-CoA kinase